jgi:hypothetical protein
LGALVLSLFGDDGSTGRGALFACYLVSLAAVVLVAITTRDSAIVIATAGVWTATCYVLTGRSRPGGGSSGDG